MSNAVGVSLGSIVTFKRGYDLPSSQRRNGIYPVISSGGISGYHSDFKKDGEAIITGRYGTLGEVYYVKGKYWPHNTTLYSTDFHDNIPKYVFYLIKCLGSLKTSDKSTVPGINRNDLHEIIIPYIENKDRQQKIASLLSALDDKIELNNKINAELEAMAKTLYDYWFVQFDFPDANGKPYKSSGGKMVYDETLKREIPEGWEVNKLGKLGNFKNGVNYDPSNPGKISCPIINVRNISNSSYFIKNEDLDVIYLNERDVRKYSVNENSIIIARSGIPGATRLISEYLPNTLYCGFAIHYDTYDIDYKNAIFFLLKSLEAQIKNGSGGTIMKNVNQAVLNDVLFVVPPKRLLTQFNDYMRNIFKKINNIEKQNQEIAQLRDWLLPMLMNGQITVAEAEEKVGMVAEGSLEYKL